MKSNSFAIGLVGSAVLAILAPFSAIGQVVPDATLPSNSVVNVDGDRFAIDGGTTVNGNLFHSFEAFSVPTGGGAFFNNAIGIENIFSRVTGTSTSQIDGVLGANGTANLFFLNPNGIVFGPNARLELGGSFFASTADSVVFDNGFEFSASNPQTESLLVVDMPVGLQFRDNPGQIVNRSVAEDSTGTPVGLQVPSGETLALVGGDMELDGGRLESFGGNIILGGLLESGFIELNSDISLIFPETLKYSDIQLQEASTIDVRGADGGNISIYGNNINILGGITGGSFLIAGIVAGFGSNQSQVGNILIASQGTVTLDNESLISNEIEFEGIGKGGNIEISANQIQLTNASQITSKTSGEGNAGQVLLSADRVHLADGAIVSSEILGTGNAGDIMIEGREVNIEQTSLRTFTRSAGFEISDDLIRDFTFNEAAIGDGGNIKIEADSISLINVEINVSTGGQGDAGSVTINGGELISIEDSLILSSLGSRNILMITPVDGNEMLPIPIGNAG